MVLHGTEDSSSRPSKLAAPFGIARSGESASHQLSDRRRLSISFWGATVLHSSLLLISFVSYKPPAREPREPSNTEGIPVSLQISPRVPGLVPGGGSEQPDPKGTLRAVPPEARAQATKVLPVGRAINARAQRSPIKTADSVQNQAETAPPAHEASGPDDTDFLPSAGQHAGQFADQSRSFAVAADRHTPSVSRFVGYGPGAYGGPGGPGAGFGSRSGTVTREFAFGGPTGAFRGDVCFFEQHVTSLADIKDCRPAATFYTNVINVPARRFTDGFPGISQRVEWFSIRYRGKLKVTATGTYKFRLLSDDGALLYIDGRCVINNDGQHAPTSREGSVALDAGLHDLFVSYYQGPRESIALQLFVTPQNGSERLLSPTL